MEGGTEDSTAQASKDREIELIRKRIQNKKLSVTLYKSNINTVTEELVSLEIL